MQDISNRGNCVWKGLYENSVLYTEFFCNPVTAVKNKVYYCLKKKITMFSNKHGTFIKADQ